MSKWIPWNPHEKVPTGMVAILRSDGSEERGQASVFSWGWDSEDRHGINIVFWRRVGSYINERYVVLSERDTEDWRESCGPWIAETFAHNMTLTKALEHRTRMQGNGGRTQLCRLVFVNDEGEEL